MDRVVDGVGERKEEMKEEGKGREERVMVSFPHMRRRLTPPHPLYSKKGRNKSISRVRGICVIY